MSEQISQPKPFLLQLYFVIASVIGLILIIMSGVNLLKLGLNQVLGVKPYPEFSAPYPAVREPGLVNANEPSLTDEQRAKVAEWEIQYEQWQKAQIEYNQADQQTKREIATGLAMLIVGLPVFAFHAPYIFKKKL